jgi:hypothetical protein
MSSEGIDTSRDTGQDPSGVWAATAVTEVSDWLNATDPAALRASQRAWQRAVETDFPAGGDITCDPWTFMPLRETCLTTIAVTGPPPDLLITALDAAGARMLSVLGNGRELEVEELDELDELDDADDDADYFTPNYVSAAERYGDIVGISTIDTKGVRYPWMLRTFLRITAEELREAGAVPARIIPFLTAERLAWLAERAERFPPPDELS